MGNNSSSSDVDTNNILLKLDAINVWITRIKAQAIKLQSILDKSKISQENKPVPISEEDEKSVTSEIKRLDKLIQTKKEKFDIYSKQIEKIVAAANRKPYVKDAAGDIIIDISKFVSADTDTTRVTLGSNPEEPQQGEVGEVQQQGEGQGRGRAASMDNYPSTGGYYYPSSSSKRNRKSLKNRKKYKGKGKSRSQGRSRRIGMSRGRSQGRGRSRGRGRQ